MNRLAIAILCLSLAALGVQAQQMDVVGTDGDTDSYDLADLGYLTFDETASGDGPDLLCVYTASGVTQYAVTGIDSVGFPSSTQLAIYLSAGGSDVYTLADLDSLNFAQSASGDVYITYSGSSVTVDNPYASSGVAIDVSGADVTVTSTIASNDVVYVLSGTTSDGMFKAYSDSNFALRLDGVTITNGDGPAINIQADEGIAVELVDGTTSTLTDGVTYAEAPNDEDQKAVFFSEGQLIFGGAGTLYLNGLGDDQHGLVSDDYISVESGTIYLLSATKDGVHTNDGYFQSGGAVEIASGSDGIDGGDGNVEISAGTLTVVNTADDKDAVKTDGDILISGGTIDLTVEGDQAKGLNAVNVSLTGGTITIDTSGDLVLEASGSGYDPSYCTGVKADDLIEIDGASVTITSIGEAGRGFSCDGDIVMSSGLIDVDCDGDGGAYTNEEGQTDVYRGHCLKADGDITLAGGTITLDNSGSAGKGISGDNDLTIGSTSSAPVVSVTTTGATINVGWDDGAEAKAVSVDSLVTLVDGDVTIDSADDGIKSKSRINIEGGSLEILDAFEGLEAPMIYVYGGEHHVTAEDDAFNATYGNGGEQDDGSILSFDGGYVYASSSEGDCVDSNGSLYINGGVLVVHGPPSEPEVGVDVNGDFQMNGGFLVASGIYSMQTEGPSYASSQRSALLYTNMSLSAGTLFHIETSGGTDLLTFAPERRYSSIIFSSDELVSGTTYRVYTGGSCTGTEEDGLYTGGTYSGGTLRTSFTANSTTQTVHF